MSTTRTMPGGRADRSELATGPNGRALCRWCAMEVPPRRFTFCSEWCVHEWKLRTNPGYLRERVLARDKGRCRECQVDTLAALIAIKRARGERREILLGRWGLRTFTRRSLWEADHVVPVAEGGGECDLENIRTLCLVCHRQATKELRERLRRTKANLEEPAKSAG